MLPVVLLCLGVASVAVATPAIDAGFSDSDLLPAVFDPSQKKYTGVPEHLPSNFRASNNFAPSSNFGSSQGFDNSQFVSNSFVPPQPSSFRFAQDFSSTQHSSPPQNNFAQPLRNTQFASTQTNFQNSQQQFAPRRPFIHLVERNQQTDPRGQYQLSFKDSAGTSISEAGSLQQSSQQTGDVLVKSGSYSYTSPEGIPITVSYTADENGFRPTG